jgi:hypothetical protein
METGAPLLEVRGGENLNFPSVSMWSTDPSFAALMMTTKRPATKSGDKSMLLERSVNPSRIQKDRTHSKSVGKGMPAKRAPRQPLKENRVHVEKKIPPKKQVEVPQLSMRSKGPVKMQNIRAASSISEFAPRAVMPATFTTMEEDKVRPSSAEHSKIARLFEKKYGGRVNPVRSRPASAADLQPSLSSSSSLHDDHDDSHSAAECSDNMHHHSHHSHHHSHYRSSSPTGNRGRGDVEKWSHLLEAFELAEKRAKESIEASGSGMAGDEAGHFVVTRSEGVRGGERRPGTAPLPSKADSRSSRVGGNGNGNWKKEWEKERTLRMQERSRYNAELLRNEKALAAAHVEQRLKEMRGL